MAQNESDYFRVGLLGPPGVGKTSLVTALLAESMVLMAGRRLAMDPVGRATEAKLSDNRFELERYLLDGTFSTPGLHTTAEPFSFTLQISYESQVVINIELRDFPGGWLSEPDRRVHAAADWEGLRDFLAKATILLIPVDAVLLMESTTAEQMRALPRLAALDELRIAARDWAVARGANTAEPALAIFCPVKCESYFADNGGRADRSVILQEKVSQFYGGILEEIREQAPEARILYSPVDTIGCVELAHVEWTSAAAAGQLDLMASYRIRDPGMIARIGAGDVVRALCRHLYQARRAVLDAESSDLGRHAAQALQLASARHWLLYEFWLWITGERAARNRVAQAAAKRAGQAVERVAELDTILREIGDPPYGPRVRDVSHRMQVHVRTRGRSADYQFLGEPPGAPWWRSYAAVTDLERPTVLVQSDGRAWQAYIAGLGSSRRDRSFRSIQFDLVLRGESNPAYGDDHDLVLAVITTVLTDLADNPDQRAVGTRLGSALSEPLIEQWLSSPGALTSSMAATAVRDAYRDFRAEQFGDAGPTLARWVGGLGSPASRAQFLALVRRLLSGLPGQALMPSYIEDVHDAAEIQAGEGDLGVLVSRPGSLYDAEPREIPG